MSEQYCPNCKEKAFVWAIDEDVSPNTQWYCSACKYRAEEDESAEGICDECGTKNKMLLKSKNECFRFCSNCQSKDAAEQW
jgi:hypothetical protein